MVAVRHTRDGNRFLWDTRDGLSIIDANCRLTLAHGRLMETVGLGLGLMSSTRDSSLG